MYWECLALVKPQHIGIFFEPFVYHLGGKAGQAFHTKRFNGKRGHHVANHHRTFNGLQAIPVFKACQIPGKSAAKRVPGAGGIVYVLQNIRRQLGNAFMAY